MAKRGKYRGKLRRTVALLAVVLIGFCVLASVSDKGIAGIDLPVSGDFALPEGIDGFGDYFKELAGLFELEEEGRHVFNPVEEGLLEVHFLDVGQAKAILVKAPEKSVLIDAGENGQGPEVVRYLRDNGVDRLDIAIGTHPHSDHIGGLDTVILEMQVDTVILPVILDESMPTTKTYTDLLEAIDTVGLPITPAVAGDTYDLGGGATMTILAPVTNYSDLNNISVASRVDFGYTGFVFTGDIEAAAERDIVESGAYLAADVLDVAHHGSNSSTTNEFLQECMPSIAVISCGIDNSYGHPNREVVERLTAAGARIYRTDLDGTVVITSDGDVTEITTGK